MGVMKLIVLIIVQFLSEILLIATLELKMVWSAVRDKNHVQEIPVKKSALGRYIKKGIFFLYSNLNLSLYLHY